MNGGSKNDSLLWPINTGSFLTSLLFLCPLFLCCVMLLMILEETA